MPNEPLSLHELNLLIRKTLDTQMDPSYWVIAEIGELRPNQKGHCYLELVEKVEHQVVAKIRGNIWSYTWRNIAPWFEAMTGQSLKSGLKILCQVSVQFHEIYGISLTIKDIDANYTLGERARLRQQIIQRLKEEYLFDLNKEIPLPLVPQRLAVISSPTAAGYEDFLNQLTHNRYGYQFSIRFFKAVMQGDEAPSSIAGALEYIGMEKDQFDAVALIRGGGSQVDMDCFDSYDLAAAIAHCPLPVFTGIGHERDESIADMVANTRLKTPTAVSEFLISGILMYEEQMESAFETISLQAQTQVSNHHKHLLSRANSLLRISQQNINQEKNRLTKWEQKIRQIMAKILHQEQAQLRLYENAIRLLDPTATLQRGFTLTTLNGRPISEKNSPKPGNTLEIYSYSHKITSQVEAVEKRK
jgi:exodeoxyribonuclease VII large subunit